MLTPNEALMESKGLSTERRELLKAAYSRMSLLTMRPEAFANSGKEALEVSKGLESHIQMLWGFDLDPKYWYMDFLIKGCTCPVMDNQELTGKTTTRIYNRRCPIHGENNTEEF